MDNEPARETLRERLAAREQRCSPVWDTLWRPASIDRIAVALGPSEDTVKRCKPFCEKLDFRPPAARPATWTDAWQDALAEQIPGLVAAIGLPGAACLSLHVPRFVHGQSQGICDLFGARVEEQEGGHMYVHPLPADPAQLRDLQPAPLERSMYWGAVEWIRMTRDITDGLLPFKNPIMTGPFDTANYLLGTTVLLEWVYTEPESVHLLLQKVTSVIIAMIKALRQAADGMLQCSHHLRCMRGGCDFASECRSLVSRDIYEEFEAPYLRRIGEQLGPYAIHSCGSWERTVPSALQDPNLRAMNGQVRENDLAELCRQAEGKVTLSIGPSANLPDTYTWPDTESYYRYILEHTPQDQPLEIGMREDSIPTWNRLCDEAGRPHDRVATEWRFCPTRGSCAWVLKA